jgi:glycosyltransferase involved in cell wall biosynthesis
LIGKGLEQSGIPGGKYIAKFIQRFEFKNLENASKIAVISPAMKSALESMGISSSAITLIPLYGINRIQEIDNQEAKLTNGWEKNSFTVVHSGNMGNKQHLETLIEAARILDTESGINFYLVGHGNRENKLKELAFGMGNIHFLPSVSDEKFPAILAGADLLLVSERASQTEMSLPSKLTSYFFSNRPVIASVPTSGATAQYLNGLALIVPAENSEILAEGIIHLKTNVEKRKMLAKKALDFAQSNLSIENGRKRYVNWVLSR